MTPDVVVQGVLPVDSPASTEEQEENEEVYEQPPPGPSLGERLTITPGGDVLSEEQKAECAKSLRSSSLFRYCSEESIMKVTEYMRREEFSEGQVRALGLCWICGVVLLSTYFTVYRIPFFLGCVPMYFNVHTHVLCHTVLSKRGNRGREKRSFTVDILLCFWFIAGCCYQIVTVLKARFEHLGAIQSMKATNTSPDIPSSKT